MTLRITGLDPDPLHEVPALNAGGRGLVEPIRIPVLRGRVAGLPPDLEALVVAADLQAMERPTGLRPPRLIGEVVVEALARLAEEEVIPPLAATGAVLAGDLWSDPACARRGGLGDVTPVWEAFEEACRWVVGVAGNHDAFGRSGPPRRPRARLLDGERVELDDGLWVAGVSGIIGREGKPWRRSDDGFADAVLDALAPGADLLVLHEPPEVDARRRGSLTITDALEATGGAALVCCGHVFWPEPLAELAGRQVLNANGRVVVLVAGRA